MTEKQQSKISNARKRSLWSLKSWHRCDEARYPALHPERSELTIKSASRSLQILGPLWFFKSFNKIWVAQLHNRYHCRLRAPGSSLSLVCCPEFGSPLHVLPVFLQKHGVFPPFSIPHIWMYVHGAGLMDWCSIQGVLLFYLQRSPIRIKSLMIIKISEWVY